MSHIIKFENNDIVVNKYNLEIGSTLKNLKDNKADKHNTLLSGKVFIDTTGQTVENKYGLIVGDNSGNVSLNVNDEAGNANLTFNHHFMRTDSSDTTQSAGRITCRVDEQLSEMKFSLKSSTTGPNISTDLTDILVLSETSIDCNKNTSIIGNLTINGTITNTNLTNDLASKASISHTHPISDIVSLQTELDSKQSRLTQSSSNNIINATVTKSSSETIDEKIPNQTYVDNKIPYSLPSTSSATANDILTYNGSNVVWSPQSGVEIISFLSRGSGEEESLSNLKTSFQDNDYVNLKSIFTDNSTNGAHNNTRGSYTSGSFFEVPSDGYYFFYVNVQWNMESFKQTGILRISIAPENHGGPVGTTVNEYLSSFYGNNESHRKYFSSSVNGILYCKQGWKMCVFGGHSTSRSYPTVIKNTTTFFGGYKLG